MNPRKPFLSTKRLPPGEDGDRSRTFSCSMKTQNNPQAGHPGMVTIPEKNCFWDSCLHPLQGGSQIHVPLQPGLTIKPLQPTLGGTRTKPCSQVLSPSETQLCAEARTGLLCDLDKTGFEFEFCQPLIKETWESLITIWSPSYFVYSIQRWFKKLDLINKVH